MMNTSKAVDEEGFQVALLKHGLHAMHSHLANLFNHLVCMGFPLSNKPWSHHTIHLIHKSSSSMDPNNYRTIMVGHTISKLYATILHLKFSRELERRQLRARGQDGFRLEHQTIDHIFTLQAIIEEARLHSSKIYCFFGDFWKAFDSIPPST